MLNIYLVRHGQDEDNKKGILNGRRDKSLTKKGVLQADKLAKRILSEKIKFENIYSSPLKRAYQTAFIITNTLGVEKPEVFEELIERDFGIMTGKHHDSIPKICRPHTLQTEKVEYFLNSSGAESFPQLIRRSRAVLRKIKKKNKLGNVLLVTHGDIGKMIYASYYGTSWKRVLKMFHFGNSDMLLLSKNSPAGNFHVIYSLQHSLYF